MPQQNSLGEDHFQIPEVTGNGPHRVLLSLDQCHSRIKVHLVVDHHHAIEIDKTISRSCLYLCLPPEAHSLKCAGLVRGREDPKVLLEDLHDQCRLVPLRVNHHDLEVAPKVLYGACPLDLVQSNPDHKVQVVDQNLPLEARL